MGILCSYIHQNKGYSPITGFFWGFCLFILGLLVVLTERPKAEQMEADKGKLTMTQWLLIFLGIGIVFIVAFFILTIFM